MLWTTVASTNFLLGSKQEECVSLTVEKNQVYWAAYVISGKNDKNVNVALTGPNDTVYYKSKEKSREGSLEQRAYHHGVYKLCFVNLDKHPKTVSFEFSVDEVSSEDLTTELSFTDLNVRLRSMMRETEAIYRNIQFYRKREAVHRDLLEAACDKVLWSALGKMAVIIGICFGQVFILKGFFKNQKGVGA